MRQFSNERCMQHLEKTARCVSSRSPAVFPASTWANNSVTDAIAKGVQRFGGASRLDALARVSAPEDFGYDFRDWVSPYTKTACRLGSVAVVLQDWASADGLRAGPDPEVQEYGRTRGLRTNRMLEALLGRVFGLTLAEVYATNAFPLRQIRGYVECPSSG
jgi:hypothetical protein